jgi:hypothetical protein
MMLHPPVSISVLSPEFVNVYEAQESIATGWALIPGILKRFTNTGSDEV